MFLLYKIQKLLENLNHLDSSKILNKCFNVIAENLKSNLHYSQ